MTRKSVTRREISFRVSFTGSMGRRLEKIASDEGLYASSLIREVVEAFVVSRDSLCPDEDSQNEDDDTLEDKLRKELIALNSEIIKICDKRDRVRDSLIKQKYSGDDGDEGHDEFDDVDPDEGDDFGFDEDQ